jgi:hypothetical protein
MKKYFILLLFLTAAQGLFAQEKKSEVPKKQFIFIIRSKSDFKAFTAEAIQTNIQHWVDYMNELAKTGKIAGGYHTGAEGEIISGPDKKVSSGAYIANNEMVSSFLVINAAGMDEAKSIAQKCPIFELGGNIEIRSLMETAK